MSVATAERRRLAAGSDGLANAGFVGEEVCASQERDALVGKRELVQGTSDLVLKPVLASVRATSARRASGIRRGRRSGGVVSTESSAREKELQVTAHWRCGQGGGGGVRPGPASSGALCLVWCSAVAILKFFIILKEEPFLAQVQLRTVCKNFGPVLLPGRSKERSMQERWTAVESGSSHDVTSCH